VTVNNRGLYGQPTAPYVDNRVYAGTDVFVDMQFLDHTQTAVTPTSIAWQLDDITNVANMVPGTPIAPTGSAMTLQIPGSVLAFTYPSIGQGSQLCQLWIQAVAVDSVTGQPFTMNAISIIEIMAIQTPNGTVP
jgi:hypothetical protein